MRRWRERALLKVPGAGRGPVGLKGVRGASKTNRGDITS